MSLFDKISLSWLVPLTIVRAFFGFGSRMADSSSLHWRQKLSISLLQAFRRTLNPRHTSSHSRQRLTGAAVKDYCCSRGLEYAAVTVSLPEYNSAHEVTRQVPCPTLHIVTPASAPANGPALLYAHGGGYLNPLQAPGHMPFALQCAASCGASRIIFVERTSYSNHESDYLSAQQVEIFIQLFEPSLTEVWASPIEADDATDVWKTAFPPALAMAASGAPTRSVAKRTLVTSGAGETLFDSCVKFAAELLHADMVVLDSDDKVALAAGKDLVLTIAPDEAHVQPVLDSALRYPYGWSMKAINQFLKSV
ncbi:hypothetical protein LMH87_003087 [Akanthomyces muscarius]|uniref:Alpha/beta hydrolase fold-3 domain-containing protein n=1 Tax=Akanthomyces muscarius TaxID=2231603 RepID=A0A9W8UHN9_AKAMU|nr:hypothetical protein LMH87_003087 [Akanthomyces muscarius]KAJ4148626.1 hypothetical protein LMH87_003087 [Akanthomyces muscarius]